MTSTFYQKKNLSIFTEKIKAAFLHETCVDPAARLFGKRCVFIFGMIPTRTVLSGLKQYFRERCGAAADLLSRQREMMYYEGDM